MDTLVSKTAVVLLDRRVEGAGGLFAFALLYLGYAYLYLFLSTAGGL